MARQNRLLLDLYRGYSSRSSQSQFVCRQCRSTLNTTPSRSFTSTRSSRNLLEALGGQGNKNGVEESLIEDEVQPAAMRNSPFLKLEWIGTEKWHQERRASLRVPFSSFQPPPPKEFSPTEIKNVVHRAIVEVFTIKAASMPVRRVSDLQADSVNDIALATTIGVSEDGSQVTLGFPNEETRVSFIPTQAPAQQPPVIEAQEVNEATEASEANETRAEEVEAAADTPSVPEKSVRDVIGDAAVVDSDIEAWRSLSLADPEIKFALIKRVMQLSGLRASDHALNGAPTAGALFETLVIAPKKPKLAEGLLANAELVALPNVRVSGKRIGEVTRETEIGRWKVIKEELLRRDLPLQRS